MAAMAARLLCLELILLCCIVQPAFGTRLVDDHGAGLRMELIHWDSPSIRDNDKSFPERLSSVVAWSNARATMHSRGPRHGGYRSPLTPYPGAYLMEIAVGTPVQKFKVIADTGSDLVWMKIDACLACNETTFATELSTTYEPVPCSSAACQDPASLLQDYTYCVSNLVSPRLGKQCGSLYMYGSGYAMVYLGKDTVSLMSTKHKKRSSTQHYKGFQDVLIGGASAYAGFDNLTAGIAGLGQGPLSLVTQLGPAIRNKFSYCLVDLRASSHSSPLLFGDAAKLKGEGIQSTPILTDKRMPTYYGLMLDAVKIGEEVVAVNPNSTTIIDSGTTLTYLEIETYNKVLEIFQNVTELPRVETGFLELCYNISGNKDYKFPAFSLELHGATLNAPQANYVIPVDDQGEIVCLAFYPGGMTIIGNMMQQNFHVLYDRNVAMLSFEPAECGKL